MTTATDIDVSALVGEMEAVPCEHHAHTREPAFHTDEPASHYVQAHCKSCGHVSDVKAMCPGFVATVRANVPVRCARCRVIAHGVESTTILGPVNQ